ncbi:MAG: hypothetical protein WCF54_05575 [Terracidiphilus sp.]
MSREEPGEFERKEKPQWPPTLEPIPLGRYRQTCFQKTTEMLIGWMFFALIIGGGGYYCVHLIQNYRHIHQDIRDKAAKIVNPFFKDGDISEIGYIYEMRRENYIRDNSWNLVWFIAIPETGVKYSCKYEEGYQDFKVGDSVRIIRKPFDFQDGGEYVNIVGLHDRQQGKASIAWTNDLKVLEMIPDS